MIGWRIESDKWTIHISLIRLCRLHSLEISTVHVHLHLFTRQSRFNITPIRPSQLFFRDAERFSNVVDVNKNINLIPHAVNSFPTRGSHWVSKFDRIKKKGLRKTGKSSPEARCLKSKIAWC